jgi:hypothetical protein
MIMSETETTRESKTESTSGTAPKGSFAHTIVDIGLTWADAGIGIGKTALENSARALDRTAKCLEAFQGKLKGTASQAAAKEPANEANVKAAGAAAQAELPSA